MRLLLPAAVFLILVAPLTAATALPRLAVKAQADGAILVRTDTGERVILNGFNHIHSPGLSSMYASFSPFIPFVFKSELESLVV